MCVACLEFIKDKLTLKEFKAALGETTRNDPDHLDEVAELIQKQASTPEKLREELQKQVSSRKR